MKVRQIFGTKVVPANREVGLEIEMEGINVASIRGVRNKWKSEQDASLRGNSVEWVLPGPVERQTVRRRIHSLSVAIKRSPHKVKLLPSDRCGVHVHINVQPLEEEELFKFITLYLMFEPLLVHWCGDDREGNMFCLRAIDAEELILALMYVRRTGSWRGIAHDGYRYAAMNVAALAKYGSLEFRAMRTPENLMRIPVWVDALLALKDYALRMETCEDMVHGISAMGFGPFAQEVLGVELFQEFWCPEGDRLIATGTRLAQMVAFTKREQKKADPVEALLVRGEAQPDKPQRGAVPLRAPLPDLIQPVEINLEPEAEN